MMISNGEILTFDRPAVLMGSIPVRIGTAFGGAIAYWTTASNMLAAIDFDLRSVDVGCRATAKEIDCRGNFLDIPKTV